MRTKPPADLTRPGRDLWRWLAAEFDIDGTQPLVGEICRLADRLAAVRLALTRDGMMKGGKRHPLADLEIKLVGQYGRMWRLLGLADADEERRPPGRPAEPDRRARKGL